MKSQISSNGFQEQIRGERTKQTSCNHCSSTGWMLLKTPQAEWSLLGTKSGTKNMIDNMIFPIEKDIPIIWDFHC